MRGGIVQQALALAQVSPQSGNVTPELETGTQQAVLVQAAKPLGIAHIGLASRDMLGVTGVDEHHLEPALLKNRPGRDDEGERRVCGSPWRAIPGSRSAWRPAPGTSQAAIAPDRRDAIVRRHGWRAWVRSRSSPPAD